MYFYVEAIKLLGSLGIVLDPYPQISIRLQVASILQELDHFLLRPLSRKFGLRYHFFSEQHCCGKKAGITTKDPLIIRDPGGGGHPLECPPAGSSVSPKKNPVHEFKTAKERIRQERAKAAAALEGATAGATASTPASKKTPFEKALADGTTTCRGRSSEQTEDGPAGDNTTHEEQTNKVETGDNEVSTEAGSLNVEDSRSISASSSSSSLAGLTLLEVSQLAASAPGAASVVREDEEGRLVDRPGSSSSPADKRSAATTPKSCSSPKSSSPKVSSPKVSSPKVVSSPKSSTKPAVPAGGSLSSSSTSLVAPSKAKPLSNVRVVGYHTTIQVGLLQYHLALGAVRDFYSPRVEYIYMPLCSMEL